jgi:PIN domain nuclease of toxin-antitoxin system
MIWVRGFELATHTSRTRWAAVQIHPVTDEVAERGGSLGDEFPGDPADRIIAATALVLGVPLITHDAKLLDVPNLPTVW